MTLSLGRTISTLALAAGLALGTAGAAAAQTLTVKDARGDVQAFDMETDEPTGQGGVANGDIVRSVLRHDKARVSVRVKFVDLRKAGQMRGDIVRVVTNEGVKRDVTIFAGQGAWRGEASMTRPNGRPVDCDLTHKIDYANNVVTVSFPRSCVSDPRWVRLGIGAIWMNAATYYGDDAQIDGHINENTVKLSPRLRRG